MANDAYSGFTRVADRAVDPAPLRTRPLDHARGLHYRGPRRLPGPDSHRQAVLNLSLCYVVDHPFFISARAVSAHCAKRTNRRSPAVTATRPTRLPQPWQRHSEPGPAARAEAVVAPHGPTGLDVRDHDRAASLLNPDSEQAGSRSCVGRDRTDGRRALDQVAAARLGRSGHLIAAAISAAPFRRGWLVNPSRTRGDPSVQQRACRPAGHGEHARLSAVAGGLLRRRDGVGRWGEPPRYESGFRAHGSNQRFHRLLRHAVARALYRTKPRRRQPGGPKILTPQGWRRKRRQGRCCTNHSEVRCINWSAGSQM